MDPQTLIVALILLAAAGYVVKTFWPKKAKPGCDACPSNRNRSDDYT